MSKTKQDRLYNEMRREKRMKNRKKDHSLELKEKRAKNAIRANNIDELITFNDYFK